MIWGARAKAGKKTQRLLAQEKKTQLNNLEEKKTQLNNLEEKKTQLKKSSTASCWGKKKFNG